MSERLPPLLVIAGATATGKTGLAIRLAEGLRAEGTRAEIISADSRQVYRGLDIGTAKTPITERRGIPHHGLDLADPDVSFSLVDYVAAARAALEAIAGRGGLAILVGGTGLYLRAVARGLPVDELPSDPGRRLAIERAIESEGLAATAAELVAIAPELARRTDLRNPRRVARALELAGLRGDGPPPAFAGYPAAVGWIGLTVEAALHAGWIRERAAGQFAGGLLDEAAALRARYDPGLRAFSAIGYREAWSVLDGELTTEAAIDLDARRTAAFARRQRTWFRREPAIAWIATDSEHDGLPEALSASRALLANPDRASGRAARRAAPGA